MTWGAVPVGGEIKAHPAKEEKQRKAGQQGPTLTTMTKQTQTEKAQPSINIEDAFNVIADHFSDEEQRVSRDGEVYVYNYQFFTQRDIIQSLAWKADNRLEMLHAAETVDYRSKMRRPNVYGLPYLKAVAGNTIKAYLEGKATAEEKDEAVTKLEKVQAEVVNLLTFRATAAKILHERTGAEYALKEHDAEQKVRVGSSAAKIDRKSAMAQAKALGISLDEGLMDTDETQHIDRSAAGK